MSCEAVFNSPCFLLGFLPVVLVGYWAVPHNRWKLWWLIASGLAFYSLWDIRFSALLFGAALVDYFLALRMSRSARPKRCLVASICFNLGVLAFFKYAMFAAASARSLFELLNVPLAVPYFTIVLPVGISFFTFKSMSYTIDVYRGTVPVTRDLVKYLAFLSLFPDLVAGPLVRYSVLSTQLDNLPRKLEADKIAVGLSLFAIGLFKKAVVADGIASFTSQLWAVPTDLTMLTAWTAAIGFMLQLYFDFSAYSDMAIGLGAFLGLTLPVNFRAPYQALNPSDFWRRWHITLSNWLRDYLYIPLGGNRGSKSRVLLNLMCVMVLGGLWHGAAWTFVLWGTYHGALLVLYKLGGRQWDALPNAVQRAAMLLAVLLGWVIFRAPDVPAALAVYRAMFLPELTSAAVNLGSIALLVGLLVALASTIVLRPNADRDFSSMTLGKSAVLATLVALSFMAIRSGASPFLYYLF